MYADRSECQALTLAHCIIQEACFGSLLLQILKVDDYRSSRLAQLQQRQDHRVVFFQVQIGEIRCWLTFIMSIIPANGGV